MASTDNPYRPPSAPVADFRGTGPELGFAVPGATVDAGRGVSWIGEGWTLFKAAPAMWIVAMLLFVGVQFVANLLPIVGSLAAMLVGPLLLAGLLAFGHGIARGEPADLNALFIGFREKTGTLITVAVLYFLLFLGLLVVFAGGAVFLLGGAALFASGSPDQLMNSLLAGGGLLSVLLLFLVLFGVLMLLAAAYWFAPGLVLYTDLEAWPAMKESFRACLSNWLPFLVYSLVGLLVLLGGMVAFVIGVFLLSLPVLMASYYASFHDIFGRKA